MRHRVQADDVGSPVGGAPRAADRGAGQRVDDVEPEPEPLGVHDRRDDREHADPVGDEIRGVLGAHHALAEGGDQKRLELVEELRLRIALRDQLDQMHVTRRVEEVDSTEARPQRGRARLGQGVDRQPRRIAGEDRLRADMRRHFLVERLLPVHAFGDRLDHQIAFREQRQVLVVIRGNDAIGAVLRRERRGLELLQIFDRLQHDAVRITFLAGEVEQQRRNTGIGEMRGDLRAHDAGAQDGGFANQKPCLRHSIIHGLQKKSPQRGCGADGFSRQIAAITWPCRSVEGRRCSRCSCTSR